MPIPVLVRVPDVPFAIQLPVHASGNAAEDGPNHYAAEPKLRPPLGYENRAREKALERQAAAWTRCWPVWGLGRGSSILCSGRQGEFQRVEMCGGTGRGMEQGAAQSHGE